MIEVLAPAKVNLYLHVGGVRSDGLHDLSSLFVFADVGDVVTLAAQPDAGADGPTLTINGPFAAALTPFPIDENLIVKAATAVLAYAAQTGQRVPAMPAITLDKVLPVAAGIGGGSADAAAALKGLQQFWRLKISRDDLSAMAFRLGADVPACLHGDPIFVSGAGEETAAAPALPAMSLCLANPRVPTPTGPIFRAYDDANPAPSVPTGMAVDCFSSPGAFFDGLQQTRNDLQAPAIAAVPVIGEVIAAMTAQPGCALARMSGSGATVFGLFTDHQRAQAAAEGLASHGWWTVAARLLPTGLNAGEA